MNIENFRTQAFRDMVYHIQSLRGHSGIGEGKFNKINFNFNYKGDIKPIIVNGVRFDNCVGYYSIESTVIQGKTYRSVHTILYEEIEKLERAMKVRKCLDNPVVIKKQRKVKEKVVGQELEIGSIHLLTNYDATIAIKITGKTPCTYKFDKIKIILPENVENEIEDSYKRQRDFDVRLEKSDITIVDEPCEKLWYHTKANILKTNKDGNWVVKSNSYQSDWHLTDKYCKSWYIL